MPSLIDTSTDEQPLASSFICRRKITLCKGPRKDQVGGVSWQLLCMLQLQGFNNTDENPSEFRHVV